MVNLGVTTIKVKEITRKNLQLAKQRGSFKNVDEVIKSILKDKINFKAMNKFNDEVAEGKMYKKYLSGNNLQVLLRREQELDVIATALKYKIRELEEKKNIQIIKPGATPDKK